MAAYLVLGAGKFGRLALERLSRMDPEGVFTLVDRRPAALAAAAGLLRVEPVEGEACRYLAAHLPGPARWDWIVPMVPEHVACCWLRLGPLRETAWQTTPVPPALAALADVAQRGREGELFLSRAAHLCPDDCPEPPEGCPVTGEPRTPALFEVLAELQLPGWDLVVLPTQQLAPGVGGYRPAELLATASRIQAARLPVLLATACRCHGVVHGLRRKGEAW